jgi:hypothetical protein
VERMQARIRARAAAVARHPFYSWLQDDTVALEERFIFAPLFVTFIMGFSDLNKWLIRYRAPATDLERAINEHTREDQTHSRLFLEDWSKLEFDRRLGWGAARTIEWYFASPETEVFRGYGMQIMQMCVLHEDARIRWAYMEAIEACGHVFFGATVRIARKLAAKTGLDYRYFGPYHFARESGHLQTDLARSESIHLSEAEEETCVRLVDRIFDMFEVENDHLLNYAKRALTGHVQSTFKGMIPRSLTRSERPEHRAEPAQGVIPWSQMSVRGVLERRKQATAAHRLFRWLKEDQSLSKLAKLRCLALLWAPDVMGYKDLNAYALTYRRPVDARERALNRWTAGLQSHHRLFLTDWQALEMDEWLKWGARETLFFYCLSERSETQRKNMTQFVDLAFRYHDPALRFWLIEALEATGEPFFAVTRWLAESVEREAGPRLDYLAGRHEASHPVMPRDDEAAAVSFESEELSQHQLALAERIIHTVFDKIEEQYSMTLEWLPQVEQLAREPSRHLESFTVRTASA